MASDRQLCPEIPINYSETLLKRLHGHPQVRMLHNILIPLDLSEDTDEDSENSDLDMNSNYESDVNSLLTKKKCCFAMHMFIFYVSIPSL